MKHVRSEDEDHTEPEISTPTKKKAKVKPSPKKVEQLKPATPISYEDDNDTSSDWTKRFNGLWQFQRADQRIEKAFNMLMSLGGSQCCVCSLFVTPNPFKSYKHKKLQSIVECLEAKEKSTKKIGTSTLKVISILWVWSRI